MHVTHHLRLGMILTEDICLQIIRFADAALVDSPQAFKSRLILNRHRHAIHQACEQVTEVVHIVDGDGLVKRQANPSFGSIVEVDFRLFGSLLECFNSHTFRQVDLQRVEELAVLLNVTVGLQHLAQIDGLAMDGFGYLTQTFRTMILGIECHHHGRESLSSTDVTGSFLALDMLLTRLESQAIGGTLVQVFAQADDSSGQFALELVTRSHISSRRTAKAHRQTETLGCTANDVGIDRFQQAESHQVSDDSHFQSGSVTVIDEERVVLNRAIGIRQLHDSTEEIGRGHEGRIIANDKLDVLTGSACAHDR